MAKTLYLVNPRADFPTYFGAEFLAGWGLAPATAFADLSMPTIAAMAPAGFDLRLCDQNISPIDYDIDADYVALTGKVSQWAQMQTIARRFRERGRTVLIGGPFASLCPETVGPHCDILVRGELEEIAPALFADLAAGRTRDEYVGTRPDLALSPVPRWDLYRNDRALVGSLQTSRGCPFECEFCDVIQYLGRRQRHKPIPNVIRELDRAYRFGYRSMFLADDNFTVFRQRAKELLVAIREWNERQEAGKVTFSTQLSIDAARDDELLRLCAEAGLILAFIGLETPNVDSLRTSKKRQNLGDDLPGQVRRFYDHGIAVIGGMIVGFDNDGPDIFQRQLDFAAEAALPVVTLGALVAPAATPLSERLSAEGRLLAEGSQVAAMPWNTNIVPKLMTQEELLGGLQQLANDLYRPAAFAERLLAFMRRVGERRDPQHLARWKWRSGRSVDRDGGRVLKALIARGPEEAKMVYTVCGAVSKRPQLAAFVKPWLFQYAQIRFMYEQGRIWRQHPVAEA